MLKALGGEIASIERKEEEETKLEVARRQRKIAEATNAFEALPSQSKESESLHQEIVAGFEKRMTTSDMKKRFLLRKAKRKNARKEKRARAVAEKMGEKRARKLRKKKRKNRIKRYY